MCRPSLSGFLEADQFDSNFPPSVADRTGDVNVEVYTTTKTNKLRFYSQEGAYFGYLTFEN